MTEEELAARTRCKLMDDATLSRMLDALLIELESRFGTRLTPVPAYEYKEFVEWKRSQTRFNPKLWADELVKGMANSSLFDKFASKK